MVRKKELLLILTLCLSFASLAQKNVNLVLGYGLFESERDLMQLTETRVEYALNKRFSIWGSYQFGKNFYRLSIGGINGIISFNESGFNTNKHVSYNDWMLGAKYNLREVSKPYQFNVSLGVGRHYFKEIDFFYNHILKRDEYSFYESNWWAGALSIEQSYRVLPNINLGLKLGILANVEWGIEAKSFISYSFNNRN